MALSATTVIILILGFMCAISAFNPDFDIQYHLFTRRNPMVSQPLLNGNAGILAASNYDPQQRTVVSIHGWDGNAIDDYNQAVIPAFLASDDVNLIVLDWHNGTHLGQNMVLECGRSTARFISWLKNVTGTRAEDIHVVGFSLGSHHAGIASRNVLGGVGYVTALDPAGGWGNNEHRFQPDDGLYTEAIYTNAGIVAYLGNLADANFYPNGGTNMPGCNSNSACNHFRAYLYFAESIVHGGFTGTACETFQQAMSGNCTLPGQHQMGGRLPSFGTNGTYYLRTNAASPFSMG